MEVLAPPAVTAATTPWGQAVAMVPPVATTACLVATLVAAQDWAAAMVATAPSATLAALLATTWTTTARLVRTGTPLMGPTRQEAPPATRSATCRVATPVATTTDTETVVQWLCALGAGLVCH